MIVVVIIGLLAGMVTINVRGALNRAKLNVARGEISTICNALEQFNSVYSRYPTNDEGLTILAKPSEKIKEPLLSGVPTDPWGHPYQYNCPGSTKPFDVICYGPSGKEGEDNIRSDSLKQ
jgi:general secretion pathway protein G